MFKKEEYVESAQKYVSYNDSYCIAVLTGNLHIVQILSNHKWPSHNVGDLSGISFGRGSS